MKKTLTLFCTVISIAAFGQFDSVFYYNANGTKNWWYIQQDVISFHQSNNEYTGNLNPNQVDNTIFWNDDSRKMNELHLSQSCTPMQGAMIMNQVRNEPDFNLFSYAVTKTPGVPCSQNEYVTTDDQILVLFHVTPSVSEISYLEQQYDLSIVHTPSNQLPPQGTYTYIFLVNGGKDRMETTFEVSQQIFENDLQLIKAVKPNMYFRDGLLCVSENVLSGGNLGTWYINNPGTVVWNNTNGTADADADLCECWAEGYTGDGIKIGVIDVASLEFDHPDLATVVEAYDCSQSPPAQEVSNFTLNSLVGHSMNVLGVIGATPDNTNLGQRFAVGAAYDADLYAYMTPSVNDADVTKGLQQALLNEVDIVNMSFKMSQNAMMDSEIQNLVDFGRADVNAPGGAWGTVILAGSGNQDGDYSHYPANNLNVIGVGGSNPRDFRWSSMPPDGEGWTANSQQGSSYGPPNYDYDVVAPSEVIMTTDAVNYGNVGSYTVQNGTSFSGPITAGIAAILLEKYPNQTNQSVRQLIRDGAEKVHPTIYDYNAYTSAPGYSEEMFYGRVSCINSLNLMPLGLEETSELKDLILTPIGESKYQVSVPQGYEDVELIIYSTDGSIVLDGLNSNGTNFIDINLENFATGMYVLSLTSNKGFIATGKLMK